MRGMSDTEKQIRAEIEDVFKRLGVSYTEADVQKAKSLHLNDPLDRTIAKLIMANLNEIECFNTAK